MFFKFGVCVSKLFVSLQTFSNFPQDKNISCFFNAKKNSWKSCKTHGKLMLFFLYVDTVLKACAGIPPKTHKILMFFGIFVEDIDRLYKFYSGL